MRRRVLALIALAGGCGNLTDAELGRCAESTNEWWPLQEGNSWVYDEIDFHADPPEISKDLVVQQAPASVQGLAGWQQGVRVWRTDRDGTGWRWFVDEGSASYFRRDVWLEGGAREDVPCLDLGPDEDVRSCLEAVPTEEVFFLPGRKRLDYRADRLCERSRWSESYRKWTISIGDGDDQCPLAQWRSGPAACAGTEDELLEEWTVTSVSRRIEVPAGAFDDCLCVRRFRPAEDPAERKDATYCFARGVGKVYELDEGNIVECLAEYCLDGAPCEPAGAPEYPCSTSELND